MSAGLTEENITVESLHKDTSRWGSGEGDGTTSFKGFSIKVRNFFLKAPYFLTFYYFNLLYLYIVIKIPSIV